MRYFVGVTDNKWYRFLSALKPDEVNFWRPGGATRFCAIQPAAPFLFKLHSPFNCIAGGGFLVRHSALPLSLAWRAFEQKNGARSLDELMSMIQRLRSDRNPDPIIGCTILSEPFFFQESDWVPVPDSWSSNIVQGKSYDTNDLDGRRLWQAVDERLLRMGVSVLGGSAVQENAWPGYGEAHLVNSRLGQGAFQVVVTEAYQRRCAVTGERTLPVLEAAHIKPYGKEGPHLVHNGLLLRSDVHILFDRGYITVSDDYCVEVSRRIRKEFENGRDYYAMHGMRLKSLPPASQERPSAEFLRWHNENVYIA